MNAQTKYAEAARVDSIEAADRFIEELVLPQLRKETTPEFSASEQNRLGELERSNLCAWFAIWDQQNHPRMVQLFRPKWPAELA